jgi:hypothetical protein
VQADDERRLIEKLRKIEPLFARATSAGERAAADSARARIRARLEEIERVEPTIEYRFTLSDGWSKTLFLALLRRYEIRPYRYRGQRRTTVMARVTRSFVDQVLWPEFRELDTVLRQHLRSVTARVVAEAIHRDATDAEERPDPAPRSLPPGHPADADD